jgi:Tfp pilus assembly protein PilN
MQRLDIDFCTRRSSPWAARVLLALAAAFALDVAVSYQQLKAAVAHKQALIAKAVPAQGRQKADPEELAAARETLARLATPWGSLFGALEQASSEEVALLAIEPDPRAGTVTISGDGKDYLAALTYVLNLGRAESLSRVQLMRHEAKGQQGNVAFAVSAAWKEARK